MGIVQDVFEIPDDIATGIAIGLYRRIGGVVRYATGPNKGQIVKHLKPINLKAAQQVQGVGAKILQYAKQHKKGVGIAAAGGLLIGVGAWRYNKWKKHEPKVLVDFRLALSDYIAAIRKGNMDVSKIDRLLATLELLNKDKNSKKIGIQLTAEDLGVLVRRIHEYTNKLAEDNSVDLPIEKMIQEDNVIVNLRTYLQTQKKIFEAAA